MRPPRYSGSMYSDARAATCEAPEEQLVALIAYAKRLLDQGMTGEALQSRLLLQFSTLPDGSKREIAKRDVDLAVRMARGEIPNRGATCESKELQSAQGSFRREATDGKGIESSGSNGQAAGSPAPQVASLEAGSEGTNHEATDDSEEAATDPADEAAINDSADAAGESDSSATSGRASSTTQSTSASGQTAGAGGASAAGTSSPQKPQPPKLDNAALHGLCGDIVNFFAPHTEAHPAAILVQLIVAIGNQMGRAFCEKFGSSRHHPNLFAVVVGETATSRKGTALDHVKQLMSLADPEWFDNCLVTGLSSAEGMVALVDDNSGRDNRLLGIITEFAIVLRQKQRQGNNLDPYLRMAWDGSDLQIPTRNGPLKATEAHIRLIGHITDDELNREMVDADFFSGLGNRFLWFWVNRVREIAFPKEIEDYAVAPLVNRYKDVIRFVLAHAGSHLVRSGRASGKARRSLAPSTRRASLALLPFRLELECLLGIGKRSATIPFVSRLGAGE